MKCNCPKVLESEVNVKTMIHDYCRGEVDFNKIIKEKKKVKENV